MCPNFQHHAGKCLKPQASWARRKRSGIQLGRGEYHDEVHNSLEIVILMDAACVSVVDR